MENLKPHNFFKLATYSHAALFDDDRVVWEALSYIKDYLDSEPLGKIECVIPPSVYLVSSSQISIGEGTIVEPGAYIQGPCIIGKNCTIRHGAYIRGDVIIGDQCIVGHDTEMKHSIMLDCAKAAHFAYVGDSILGNRTNLGAGTKCANLRFDNENIKIFFGDVSIETGLKKLGAILGDGTQTGCNTVTNPGTITGKEVFCYPCMQFGGYIAANQVIKPEIRTVVAQRRGAIPLS